MKLSERCTCGRLSGHLLHAGSVAFAMISTLIRAAPAGYGPVEAALEEFRIL
ncbi:MAG TPA: hypothetical protein VLC12_01095 [Terriglobales bacterium]|nr:hypothetical protein [Terriglobales bacterium]